MLNEAGRLFLIGLDADRDRQSHHISNLFVNRVRDELPKAQVANRAGSPIDNKDSLPVLALFPFALDELDRVAEPHALWDCDELAVHHTACGLWVVARELPEPFGPLQIDLLQDLFGDGVFYESEHVHGVVRREIFDDLCELYKAHPLKERSADGLLCLRQDLCPSFGL